MSIPYQKWLAEDEPYSALPLKDGQIRVLHVEGGSDQSTVDRPLIGQLQVVTLSDNPKFLALSYCWGETKKSDYVHEIKLKLDDAQRLVTIKISEAAYKALTDIREHIGSMTIWIDAICINQENIVEKEMQIPLMAEIYTLAKKVYIYLGPGTKESNIAMDWMYKASRRWYRGVGLLGPASGGGIEKYWLTIILRDWFTVFTRYIYLLILLTTIPIIIFRAFCMPLIHRFFKRSKPFITEAEIQAINALLSRPWIQRAWTWQELVLARRAVVICGYRSLSWDRFLLALSVLDLCCHGPEIQSVGEIPIHEDSAVGVLADTSRAYRKTLRHYPHGIAIENLKSWCFLAECWLRFGRTPAQKRMIRHNSTKISYLDSHLKIYTLCTLTVVVYLIVGLGFQVSDLALVIQLKIWLETKAQGLYGTSESLRSLQTDNDESLGLRIVILLIYLVFTSYSIGILMALWTNMKRYSTLPMAFATIPTLRAKKASDPRDLCYGFYGVLRAEGLAQLEAPDYGQDPRSVFKEFFLDLLQWDGRALVLLLDCCNYKEPSWSPDWRLTSQQSWLNEKYFYDLSSDRATQNSSPHFAITDDRSGLFVYGKEIHNGIIVWRSTDITTEDTSEEGQKKEAEIWNLKVLMDWLRVGMQDHMKTEADTVSLGKQIRIFEAVEASLVSSSVSEEETVLSSAINAINELRSLAKLSNGFISWLKVIEPYLFPMFYDSVKSEGANEQYLTDIMAENAAYLAFECYKKLLESDKAILYHRRICSEIAGRRRLFIFSSSQGVYFGTGSIAAEVGDRLCLVSGLPVPMLLRNLGFKSYARNGVVSESKAFSVVGPAFISRMMRGEFWPKDKDGSLTKEELTQFYLV